MPRTGGKLYRFAVVQSVVGRLSVIFSMTMLPPIAVAMFYGDGGVGAFFIGFVCSVAIGTLLYLPVRRVDVDLQTRDGFLVVVLFWVVLGMLGAIPLYALELPRLSLTDAVFESMSGLTTTGATILVGIDSLPHGLLYYRQQLQWLGGMGIVVLAVAILPMLGVGGMQLYRAETPGPIKDSKLTPRIAETAKALWYIYLGMTLTCAAAYYWAGMEPFDAMMHSFSTVAIGGFSTHDLSLGYFNSSTIEMVATFFMVLAGVNFALHFKAFRGEGPVVYFRDIELRAFITILFLLSLLSAAVLIASGTFSVSTSFVKGAFQVVSIATTAGFTTSEYHAWPAFLPVTLLLASFIGGCAGSTGGGIKVIRVLLLLKQGLREIHRLIHPNAEIPVKIGNKAVSPHVMEAVWGFFSAYVGMFALMMLFLMATGIEQVTAFSSVAACLNNLGPGLGEVASNFASINSPSKWVLVFAMLLGRLEIFTLLVILSPAFWRR